MILESIIIGIGAYILFGPEEVNPPKHLAKTLMGVHSKAKETHARVREIHRRDMEHVKKAVEKGKAHHDHLKEELVEAAAIGASALAIEEVIKLTHHKDKKEAKENTS